MIQPVRRLARTLFLVVTLLAPPLAAQVSAQGDSEVRLDSLVLVLNLISATHARPTTGVVLAGNARPGHALVLVPADFVGAGDEIIVLDGGNDILQNGRSTQTIARSGDVGVALLEVEGLDRPGVSLADDAWPTNGSRTYQFAAWPGAQALAEGATLIRDTVNPGSSLPELTGPLFDECGYLAAIQLVADGSRTAASQEMAAFLADFEIEFEHSACLEQSSETESGVSGEVTEGAQTPGQSSATDGASDQPPSAIVPAEPALTPGQKITLLSVWLMLGMLAYLLYLRRQKRRRTQPAEVVVERLAQDGKRFHHRISLDPAQLTGQFERNGLVLLIHKLKDGFELGVDEGADPHSIDLIIGGTPCLGGEKFLIGTNQEFRLGNETFVFLSDPGQSGDSKS